MAATTLKNLRARVREEANMEDSEFITDDADGMDRRINAAGQKLYAMVSAGGGAQYALSQTLLTVASQELYTLAAPAKRIHSIEFESGPVRDFGFAERNVRTRGRPGRPRYRLESATQLRLEPAPDTDALSVPIYYFPEWTLLAAETDSAELWAWEQFIIIDAAIGCSRKEEQMNLADMERERAFLLQCIEADVGERYSGPDHIVDVTERWNHEECEEAW